jgi:hypothetical protein
MDYRQLAYQTAQRYGIDPDLFLRQIQAESAFRPDAVSSAGAIGLGQLMPATAKELGVDPYDPAQNLEGAARYMRQQLDTFKDPALALAAYNAGPRRVREAGGVPNITETKNYVSKILGQGGSVMDDNTMNAQNAQAQAAAAQAAAQEQSGSDKFREVAGNLAIAFNSMRLNPDPNIASTIRDIRDARSEKQAKNKTLAYLEKIGRSDLVSAIEAGLSPKAAISQMFTEAAELRGFERQKELAKFKEGLTSGKDTADIREYNLAKSQGFQGTFADWQQTGKRRTEVGTIPQGYQLVEARNDKGETVLRMEPIAGGPADIEARELAGKAEKRAGSQQTMTDTILNEAEKARGLINNWSTGAGAFLLQGLPLTEARQLVGHVKSLQAQATIETLNAMRQESPTGGALGNVTNQENAMLAAKAGLLDPMSKPEVFKQQLDDYERTLLRIVHGPEEGDKIFSQSRLGSVTAQPGQTAQPMSDDDLLTKYGTPVQGKP